MSSPSRNLDHDCHAKLSPAGCCPRTPRHFSPPVCLKTFLRVGQFIEGDHNRRVRHGRRSRSTSSESWQSKASQGWQCLSTRELGMGPRFGRRFWIPAISACLSDLRLGPRSARRLGRVDNRDRPLHRHCVAHWMGCYRVAADRGNHFRVIDEASNHGCPNLEIFGNARRP
jgi:hypothetical protein